MCLDNVDRISDLLITLKQAKAVYNCFSDNFTSQPAKETLFAVETQFETYAYLSSVISDLIFSAVKQAEELDTEITKENITAV